VFPAGTEALQAAFYDNFERLLDPVWPLLWPRFPTDVLNPVSAEHFTRTRTGYFGKSLADVEPKGEERVETWKKVEAAFYTLYGWLSRSSGPFFMGETITFSDFVVAGMLDAIRITLGEESEEWQKVEAFNGGRWKEFLESLKQYASVDK
jgi:glutathione S-transferase